MNEKPLLIFDHDGTLHNSMFVFGPAMQKGVKWLEEQGYGKIEKFSYERLEKLLGFVAYDIWKSLKYDLSDEAIEKVSAFVNLEMRKGLNEGKAKWYDGASRMLDKLKSMGYKMVILSNCDKALASFYWDYFNMQNWFEKFYDSESYDNKQKSEIIKEIIKERKSEAIMIGDRYIDHESAKSVNIPFIGCIYGFCADGELDGADEIAESVESIPDLVEKIAINRYKMQ